MGMPVFWIVAGPNGAGKTTFVQTPQFAYLMSSVDFMNPDAMCLRLLQKQGYPAWGPCPDNVLLKTFVQAADQAWSRLRAGILRDEHVGVESVLSTDKYLPLIELVNRKSGFFGLIYVALSSPQLSLQRVKKRVSQGGHDVPAEKLDERWHRSLENLSVFASRASRFWVFDNSNSDDLSRLFAVAEGINGRLTMCDEPRCFPELLRALSPLSRAD